MGEHIGDVSKRGDWYTIKGHVDGKPTSVDIPANQVDGRSRSDAEKLFKRGLKTAKESE